MVKKVASLQELQGFATEFLRGVSARPKTTTATVVGLSGDLGAGKTAFTKCIASVLGITDVVTSPTFILEKVYSIPGDSIVGARFTKLIHIDAYRLHSASEMKALGWESILLDEHNLVFIEWPEQVEGALPENIIKLSFKHESEGVRRVEGDLI